MKKLSILNVFLILITVLCTPAESAEEIPGVDEIVDRANKAAYYAGNDGTAKVSMTITDAQGRVRKREFIILRKDVSEGGEQKFYVYFRKPGDVRKMVFMVHKKIGADDDRWLYLPALDLVKRIAAADKRTSFVGSHFLYEDVSGRSIFEDKHLLLDANDEFFILNSVPKDPSSVEFSSYKIWIDRRSFLPRKAEYTDREGRMYRTVESLEIKDIQGHPTVIKSRVQDLLNGGNTVSVFTDVRYDIGLSDIFTERYLRRAPKEARK
ncbi:MAG: outer membrane lipoprotein-sorting protein [Nitrospirota bacterium]